ncbi:SRPBCC family protein [Geotalea toluenoxydans]|uniref:SRPBCC family protein n=1 Tax=Geotalea toluenoxydans TaxID=421624 RepID=UPI0006D12ED2|nr:SRPBCC family protein [Geotalea toluenoxydans]
MEAATGATRSGLERGAKQHGKERINVGRNERTASMIGGAALAVSGLTKLAHKRILPGMALMAAGGMFLYRGKTGHCNLFEAMGVDTAGTDDKGLNVEKVLTINRSPQEVYDFWHNFENIPRFMRHLDTVRTTGVRTSHWKAKGPAGVTVEWDAEILEDYPGQRISWQSLGNADIPNEGSVEFMEAPGGRGTELKVNLTYRPPGGAAGKIAARVAHGINSQVIEEDLKRLKQIMETGETATAAYRGSETFH